MKFGFYAELFCRNSAISSYVGPEGQSPPRAVPSPSTAAPSSLVFMKSAMFSLPYMMQLVPLRSFYLYMFSRSVRIAIR
ncbi:hypothetical protein RRG08_056342 [Elysia crispata]|uniref:Uncharacterized protein n=1 Tax=Elysia crispata TaxID=231223 RepID=A0AAE0YR51_9GAST|nr:hypothetical protein RRG08_056342 [Elysia crispata]